MQRAVAVWRVLNRVRRLVLSLLHETDLLLLDKVQVLLFETGCPFSLALNAKSWLKVLPLCALQPIIIINSLALDIKLNLFIHAI